MACTLLTLGRLPRLAAVLLSLLAVVAPCRAVIRDGGVDPANLGQGGWLYLMNNATNHLSPNYISAVTNENSLFAFMKSQGMDYVIVKAGTSGTNYWDGNYSKTRPVFTSNLVTLAHANGLKIFGSNRSWGSNIVGEIWVANYVFQQGADGFIWDAESEWESGTSHPWITNGPAQAWWLCGTVRSNWPTKFLAHNPYDTLYLHSTFPYKEFGYWADCTMPQVYHHSASSNNAIAAIHWTDVNYRKWQNSLLGTSSVINGQTIYWTNSIKPLCLMRDVYGANWSAPHAAQDVMNFIDYLMADPNCVTAGGYQGSDYFRSELYDVNQWAYIKTATVGNKPGRVNNIVLDDARATRVGAWTMVKTIDATTGSQVLWYGATGGDTNSFGTNYFSIGKGTGASYMQFTPNILVPGDYKVYQWHPTRANASASTPFVINHGRGCTTVYANQLTNNGNWSLLGKFNFLAGTSGYVRITDAIPEAAGVALVDGLKLVFVASNTVPAAPTGLRVTALSSNQISLAWTSNATNETGYVVTRSLSAGGPFSTVASLGVGASSYTNTALTPATTYYYVTRATNSAGPSPDSNIANATTPMPPVITMLPQSASTNAGAHVSFQAAASGSPAPAFQWRFNGADIPGATGTSYSRFSVQPGDAGSYCMVASNVAGVATSPAAVLTVVQPYIQSVERLSPQGFQFQIQGGPGHFAIEVSPDLSHWMQLTNFSTTQSMFLFLDSDLSQSNRFYRVKGLP